MNGPGKLLVLLLAIAPLRAQAPAGADELARAHQAIEHNHVDDALAILQPMALGKPVPAGVERELGLAYYRTGKLTEARDAFAQAIQQDAQDIEAAQMEGLTLYRMHQPAAAVPYLERVRQWTPDAGTDAHYVLGLCYLSANRFDDARRSFATQFGVAPDSGAAWLLLATMLQHTSRPEQAVQYARHALELSPQLPMAHLLLGEVALLGSNVEEATKELEAERAINPSYATVYDRLGDAYLRANRLDDAQQALLKAIALDRSSTGPFILMGRVLLRRQDARTAIMYLKHAERMDPSNFVTHASLAQAYRISGQEEEAKRENELATQSHPILDDPDR